MSIKSFLSRTLIALITFGALIACGSNHERSQLSIGGGTPAETEAKSLVRIASRGLSICSGVLVASDLVLTAAHCLRNEDPSTYSIVFPLAPEDKLRSVDSFEKIKEEDLIFFPNFDLAWIKLSKAAPLPYQPATILGDTQKIKAENGLMLVGVTNDSPCHPTDSVCQLTKLNVRIKSMWSTPHLINLAVVDSVRPSDGSGTCPGDSGGPAYISYSGQDLLFGIVAGKDPIFTGGMTTSCGSPTSVLTRIGEYQDWIESSSGRKLKVVDRATAMLSVSYLTEPSRFQGSTNWTDWFQKLNPKDPAWFTVHKLLEQAVIEFQGQISAERIPLLFQNGGQEWIERITSLRNLTLGFPGHTALIQDLRPLVGLKNLTELSFLTSAYTGLDVLQKLPNLKTLSIVGRLAQSGQASLAWNLLGSPTVETVRLSQLSASQMRQIPWTNFTQLKTLTTTSPLGKLPSGSLNEEGLTSLETLNVQELTCDQTAWPKVVLPELKSLTLRSTQAAPESELSCVQWDLLPQLEELVIQGYRIDIPSFTARLPSALAENARIQNP